MSCQHLELVVCCCPRVPPARSKTHLVGLGWVLAKPGPPEMSQRWGVGGAGVGG